MSLGRGFFTKIVGPNLNDTLTTGIEVGTGLGMSANVGGSLIGSVYRGVTKEVSPGEAGDLFEAMIGRKLKRSVAMASLPVVGGAAVIVAAQKNENREAVGTVMPNAQAPAGRLHGHPMHSNITPEAFNDDYTIAGTGKEAELVFALHNMR